jgi:hypothetical protein
VIIGVKFGTDVRVKWRRVMLIGVALVASVIVTVLVWPGEKEREPVYQGKKLSEWILSQVRPPYDREGAKVAVRAIGTNGLPCLLRWVGHQEPRWKYTAQNWFYKLPTRLQWNFVFRGISPHLVTSPGFLGVQGIAILGPEAAPAIPELARLASDGGRPTVAHRAMGCLMMINDEGVTEVVKLLNAADPKIRGDATNLLMSVKPGLFLPLIRGHRALSD